MTEQQVHAFNKDLCELMRKHRIRGIAGMCIDQTGDGGVIDLHDGLSDVKAVVRHFVDVLVKETAKMGVAGTKMYTGIDVPNQKKS